MTDMPRRFHLLRHRDVSGVSGTGIVAHGVLWPDGTASVRWAGDRPSVVFWDRIEDAEAVHGHGGATEIVWDDLPLGVTRALPVQRDSLEEVLDIVCETVVEANDVGGIDLNDLVDRLTAAGYQLPAEDES